MEIAHISNVRHSLVLYTGEGLSRARANLKALGELYLSAGKNALAFEPSYAKFAQAMSDRVSAVDKAVGVLTGLLGPSDGVMTDSVIANLEAAEKACETSAAGIELAGREPKEAVPAAEGTRNDAQIIRMLADCVRIYAQCGAAESAEPFANFLTALGTTIDKSKPSRPDIVWLNVYLTNLARHVGAIDGEITVPVFSGYEWVESAAVKGARKSLFGGQETFSIQDRMLVPFWVAEIRFSEQSGAWFWKKGESAKGLLILDASRHGGQCYIESEESYLVGQCLEAVKSPKEIGQFVPAVVPVVSVDTALRCMKVSISSSDKYRGGFVSQQGIIIIYLPAAVIRYSGKNTERREIFLPGANPRTTSLSVSRLRLGTREFLVAN